MIDKPFTRPISSKKADVHFGMIACFIAACLIPVLAIRKLAGLDLSEVELLLAILASMSTAILCTVMGLQLESKTAGSEVGRTSRGSESRSRGARFL